MPELPENLPDVDPTSDVATNWKNARAEIARLKAENSHYRAASIQSSIALAGYDPNVGVVKLLREKWEESLDPEHVTPTDFKSFAETFGVQPTATPPVAQASETEGGTPATAGTPATNTPSQPETQAANLQARVDALTAASVAPASPPSLDEEIAKAEAEGRPRDSINLKFRKMTDMYRTQPAGAPAPTS